MVLNSYLGVLVFWPLLNGSGCFEAFFLEAVEMEEGFFTFDCGRLEACSAVFSVIVFRLQYYSVYAA